MKSIVDLRSVKDIEDRAWELNKKSGYIIIFSRRSNFYLEIHLNNQVKLIGQDSGIGKTYMLKRLRVLLKNKANTVDIKNINLKRIRVLLDPNTMSSEDDDTLIFIDRGDMMESKQIKILNTYLEGKNALVLFARNASGVEAELPAWEDGFEVHEIDGMDCFFIT